jgi:hypothetical protein
MLVKECKFKGSVFGKANFMTPTILGFYECGDYYVELSTSTGGVEFSGVERMFGVTVAKDRVHLHDMSKCFGSRDEANEYMQELANL